MQLLGDIGGIFEILLVLAALIMSPVVNNSFIFKVANLLFTAQSSDKTLFVSANKDKSGPQQIKVAPQEMFALLLKKTFGCSFHSSNRLAPYHKIFKRTE